MDKIIYIYNPIQAKFILKETKAEDIYRIGKGIKGDVCVSFFDTEKVRDAISKWCSNKIN